MPVRPKVGRLPPSVAARPAATPPLQFGQSDRWDGRFAVYAAALIASLALITGAVLHNGGGRPSISSENSERKPAVAAAGTAAEPVHAVNVKTPEGELVGQVIKSDLPNESGYYTVPVPAPAQPQTAVDNEDRKRLLSIISNY